MPQAVTYRLTIRTASTTANPNGTADLLVLTSIPLGTNPYIAAPPTGDGAEVDPLTGAVRTGAYVVEVVDANTGTDATGTIRVLTNRLEDATYRQQLLSRRAYLDVLRDGVSTPLIAGYIASVRLISPMRYAITVGDTRRVERTQTIFQGASLGSYTTRGCLTGGPLTANFGTIKARGGWQYRWTNVGTNLWQAQFLSGYGPTAGAPILRDWRQLVDPRAQQVVTNYTRANPFPSTGAAVTYDFAFAGTGDTGAITDGIVAFIGSTAANAVATTAVLVESSETAADNPLYSDRLVFYWPSAPYSAGTDVYISLTTADVTEACPLYLDAHPVDLVTAIWTAARVNYDTGAAWITTIRNLIGPNVRLACRFPQAPLMDEFLESAIYGPFGIAERTNSSGQQELFATRIRTDTAPSLTLTASAMRGADEVVFDLDERTAISGVRLTQQVLAPATYSANPTNQGPGDQTTANNGTLDGVSVSEITQTAQYLDPNLTVFAGRVVEYKVPGMIHTSADFVPDTAAQLDAIAVGMFDRYGRGAPAAEVAVLATDAVAAAQIGDEIYFEAPHYPNKGYRIGESTVGARILQVVRRTETPAGPVFRLLDSGLAAQPATVPTISIAKNTSAPTSTARYTITNAATLNATGVISVVVEWATGSSTPSGGADQTRYAAGTTPTGAVDLPPVTTPGTTVWVRARSEQAGRRPSAWTAWASVTLDGLASVSGLTATAIRQTAATLLWTNGTGTLPLIVYAYQGASAPADWTPYRVATLPAGTTATVVRSLSGPSVAWTLGVGYQAPQAVGPVTAVTLTTTSTLDTPTRPAGLAIIPGVDDATLTQGIALALWPSDPTLDIQIQRRIPSVTAYATIATVSGATPVYVDQLPRDSVTYQYRIAHVLGGYTTSSYTSEVSGTVRGVPTNVQRPDAVTPVVQVATSETSTTGTVTLTITDPQARVVQVQFRERTNGGAWSAWTVDSTVPYSYTGTLPASGYLDIEYEVTGFNAAGTAAQVLAGGIESFDVGTVANIVSAVGTFALTGALTIAVQADTDTNSFRYAVATTPWASDAAAYTAAQAGTLVSARNGTISLAGPYTVGSTVYLAIAAYTGASGTGTVSGPYRYAYTNGAQDTAMMTLTGSFSATGVLSLYFVGDSTVQSIKYAVSTSAFPTLATVQAAAAINARNTTQTLPSTYALGAVVYVSCVAYTGLNATGRESPVFQLAASRQNTAPTIINRQPGTSACYPTTEGTIFERALGYYVPGPTTGGTNPNRQGIHFAQVIVPRGVTMRAVRVNCYAYATPNNGGSGDIITVNFYRVESNGTNSFLGSTQQNLYNGWQTLAVSSLSESTTDRSYYVRIEANWNGYPGTTYTPNSDLRVGYIEAEYDKPNTDTNI